MDDEQVGAHGRGQPRLPRGLAVAAGLKLLRVAARLRAEQGRTAVGPFYEAIGTRLFDTARLEKLAAADQAARSLVDSALHNAGLPGGTAGALDDTAFDDIIHAETEEALALTGRDVGTPILHFMPPGGTAFFGPVISRLPSPRRRRPTLGPRDRVGCVSRIRGDQAQSS